MLHIFLCADHDVWSNKNGARGKNDSNRTERYKQSIMEILSKEPELYEI